MNARVPVRVALGLVGLVFLAAGVSKAVDGGVAAGLLARETGSVGLARALTALAAGAEAALGALLLLRASPADARAAAAALLLLTAWIVYLDLARGMGTPCGCRVPFLGEKGWAPLVRNAAMLGICWWGLRRAEVRAEFSTG